MFTPGWRPNAGDDPNRVDYGGQWGHFDINPCVLDVIFFVPNYSPKELALSAYQQVVATLTNPAPVFAPPLAKGGFVNVKSWVGIEPTAPVSADAAVPGLAVRTSAIPDHVEWDPGDGSTVVCAGLGAVYVPDGPTVPECGWTPRQPSAPKFTGTNDLMYHGSFRLVWKVTWTATNGARGDLGLAGTHLDTAYKVSEIHTIGDG